MLLPRLIVSLLAALLLATPFAATAQQDPDKVELSPLVKRLLKDELLTDKQKREAMIFHGQWQELGELSPEEKLQLAVAKHAVLAPGKDDNKAIIRAAELADVELTPTTAMLLVKGGYLAGDPRGGTHFPNDFQIDTSSPSWRVLIARCHEDLGQMTEAIKQLSPLREKAQKDAGSFKSAADLTAAAQAIIMLARLEGRPAADFHLANQLLAKARDEVDPLYWPAYIAEAELLWAKGNPRAAFDAVGQALALNPKSSEAWYLMGSMRARFFDFKNAGLSIDKLRNINKHHPLADALQVQSALRQKDIATASKTIDAALKRYPTHRQLLALSAAVKALAYDAKGKAEALKAFEKLAKGNPLAQFEVGQAYADARQYALAEPHLKRAIALMPGWSAPQLALGELYMQWGKLKEAATQLQKASTLDPFHKAITNQQRLAQEMLGYATIKTEQFVVRYLPGIDEVLARDVALHMGDMVKVFIKRFGHDPPALTQVDLMPDDQHFAVRIIGMPSIWTIAACTGDVIAMTPPRPGPKRAYGTYNWLNVMGHEYAHVVNLSQTNNRVPHWFTEGCAVRMETTGRLWSQYALLAKCYNTDKLFKYDEINWGFIRPTQPFHRPLAYAQSAWIKQYIEEEHGWDKALKMLDLYKAGVGEHETIQQVFGFDHNELMKRFSTWAGKQVKAWGMSTYGVKPEDPALAKLLATKDASTISAAVLDQAIAKHPNEPGLLKLRAERAVASANPAEALSALKAYQAARPIDPWADRELARIALKQGESQTAIKALLTLDKIEGDTPAYAVELAKVYRARKAYGQALRFAERALLREPYNATLRETAAAIAIQKGDLGRAAFHVESLALLEPKRWIHPRRLAVIYQRMGLAEKAKEAQEQAKKLKPKKEGD